MSIHVYIDTIGSPNDPYFVNENIDENKLAIVVNKQHPHWRMLEGENSVVNYLRHCVYDGVAEHRAARIRRLESDSVKRLKDNYLRVPFDVPAEARGRKRRRIEKVAFARVPSLYKSRNSLILLSRRAEP